MTSDHDGDPRRGNLDVAIDMDAPPSRVWPVVADLRRMGEWSPQCRRVVVLGRGIGRGTMLVNLNRAGLVWWPTTTRVVRYEPGRAIAFTVLENRTQWSFELEPLGDHGTRLVQRRRPPTTSPWISRTFVDTFLGGSDELTYSLRVGMTQTLERIKSAVEDG